MELDAAAVAVMAAVVAVMAAVVAVMAAGDGGLLSADNR